jgi:hypothetical protein
LESAWLNEGDVMKDEERVLVLVQKRIDDTFTFWGVNAHVSEAMARTGDRLSPQFNVIGWTPYSDYIQKNPLDTTEFLRKLHEAGKLIYPEGQGSAGVAAATPGPRRPPRVVLVQDWLKTQDKDDLMERAWAAVRAIGKGQM